MSEKKKIPEWHVALTEIIMKFLNKNEIDGADFLAYISLVFIGTIEGNGFDEDFLKRVMDEMLDDFRRKRKVRKERENGMDQT
jgi:hypothetical protein